MNITRLNNMILFEIQQDEYYYWETFTDKLIDKCTKIIDEKQVTKTLLPKFQSFKECLELILFTVDISKQDKKCTVKVPSEFLTLMFMLMKKWHEKLRCELQHVKSKQAETINGENKRQLYEKQKHLEQILSVNTLMIEQISTYRKEEG